MPKSPGNDDAELALHVGARIREVREARGLTLQEVVDRGGITAKSHLSRIERGQVQLTVSTLARLAECLGTTARDLVPQWPVDRGRILERVERLDDAALVRVAELLDLLEEPSTDDS